MRSTRENVSSPAAGKKVAAPATRHASDSPSCLGLGATSGRCRNPLAITEVKLRMISPYVLPF